MNVDDDVKDMSGKGNDTRTRVHLEMLNATRTVSSSSPTSETTEGFVGPRLSSIEFVDELQKASFSVVLLSVQTSFDLSQLTSFKEFRPLVMLAR